ncbi:MAG: glycosyltransferase [Desulfarculaceae bacterium]|nr:glycosyltransferase [Desulfarculaceae bacterium]MCF8072093.1 glycosyltransferase [Desulfarculaceae bacterium]MCF8100014.1 glycosyltransferase [Desulfarculaceae bacterium]
MSDRKDKEVSLDIIIPVFNEQDVINILFERLGEVFSSRTKKKHKIAKVKYVFIDDGSTDDTPKIIKAYIDEGFPAKLAVLSKNFGHQQALMCGLDYTDEPIRMVHQRA